MIAISHPGKHGDILYSMACIKYLCDKHECQADFFTSAHAPTLNRVFEYQDHINNFIVCGEREDFWGGWGIQPWDMTRWIDMGQYEAFYQLGFENFPDRQVHKFYFDELGVEDAPLNLTGVFDYPTLESTEYSELLGIEYICIAPRGDVDFHATYNAIMDRSPVPIVQIGGVGETMEHDNMLDYTCIDWLETLSILSNAKAFIGPISSQGALAHNFDFPKAFVTHMGYGAGIGMLPITPTTSMFMQEQGGLGPVDQIMEMICLS
jgi:hypothetical protein